MPTAAVARPCRVRSPSVSGPSPSARRSSRPSKTTNSSPLHEALRWNRPSNAKTFRDHYSGRQACLVASAPGTSTGSWTRVR